MLASKADSRKTRTGDNLAGGQKKFSLSCYSQFCKVILGVVIQQIFEGSPLALLYTMA